MKNFNNLHRPWMSVRRGHSFGKFHTLGYRAIYPWLRNCQDILNFITIESFLLSTICTNFVIFFWNSIWIKQGFVKGSQGVWNYPSDWIAVKTIHSHKLQFWNYPTLLVHWNIRKIKKNHNLSFEFFLCVCEEVSNNDWKVSVVFS